MRITLATTNMKLMSSRFLIHSMRTLATKLILEVSLLHPAIMLFILQWKKKRRFLGSFLKPQLIRLDTAMPVTSISLEQECPPFRICTHRFVFSINFQLTGKSGLVSSKKMSQEGGKIIVERELSWISRWLTRMALKFKRPFSERKLPGNMAQWSERIRCFCSPTDKLSLPTKSSPPSRTTTVWPSTKMLT